jgi:hypothetical protein
MAIDKINATALLDGGVSTADIADDAITTAKIADSQITDGKIAAVAATKLTGTVADARFPAALPAVSGAALTNLPADTTKAPLANPTFTGTVSKTGSSSGTSKVFTTSSTATENWFYIGSSQTHFRTQGDSANRLTLTDDGRGLSQFTAKAWVNFNGEGTVSINDSHNVSSITDDAIGKYTVNFSNAMGNTHYAVAAQTEDGGGYNDPRVINHESSQARTTTAYGLYHWHIVTAQLDDATKMNVIVFGD